MEGVIDKTKYKCQEQKGSLRSFKGKQGPKDLGQRLLLSQVITSKLDGKRNSWDKKQCQNRILSIQADH